MDQLSLQKRLSDLPLGEIRYFEQVGSTNDLALDWANQSAPDFSLVIANEQTAGRGRAGRKWSTPPNSGLALSLILHPSTTEQASPLLFTGLGALGLVQALKKYSLPAQIKWPNDVLLNGKKAAGILVETAWIGGQIENLVLGMGVNILKSALPAAEELQFPATSLEEALGRAPDRIQVLHDVLAGIIDWRQHLGTKTFILAWEAALAYKGKTVQIWTGNDVSLIGQIEGLESDGSLRLRLSRNENRIVRFGEVHLRPFNRVA
jgi:BirA family biotin operon repressor/biotin-[acetyl-CoA-carboxylase] ligase